MHYCPFRLCIVCVIAVKPIVLGKVAKHLMPKHMYRAWNLKAEVSDCIAIAVTVTVSVT